MKWQDLCQVGLGEWLSLLLSWIITSTVCAESINPRFSSLRTSLLAAPLLRDSHTPPLSAACNKPSISWLLVHLYQSSWSTQSQFFCTGVHSPSPSQVNPKAVQVITQQKEKLFTQTNIFLWPFKKLINDA